jgi:hypothetical protein
MADLTAMLQAAAGAAVGEYQISRSLRFNSADSAYLSRTPASASNQKTWTWSGWVKRSALSTTQLCFATYFANNDTSQFQIGFNTDNKLQVAFYSLVPLVSTQVFRDVSAWYHLVVSFDSTQGTASNRLKAYINGLEVTSWATDNRSSISNQDYGINAAEAHFIGYGNYAGSYFNGYLTEINFIDGQQLTPSSFGETNETTGVWSPIRYAGSYGTNGFYLNFSDNTSTTTLGEDQAGSNDWTLNNFSVTAGAGNDSLVDTPTQYGTDTGAGGQVRGNYCTLNPLDKNASATLNNGNLVQDASSSAWRAVRSTMFVSSGKWYWEGTVDGSGPDIGIIGVSNQSASLSAPPDANAWGYNGTDGNKFHNGVSAAYGATYANGNTIGIALDMDAGTITFYKNGSTQGQAFSGLSGSLTPTFFQYSGYTWTANFGQRPFAYTAPSGFKALVTTNLPDPTVVQGDDYFNTVLWTGDGNTRSITGVGFAPDLIVTKSRNNAFIPGWWDKVRGTGKVLASDRTDSESSLGTAGGSITAFDSDGWTMQNGTVNFSWINQTSATYVAWNWKANGAGVSNTDGSITSTVSANTIAGISIVTYTGNGVAGATVGHGLGAVPRMIIVKNRDQADAWQVYQAANTANPETDYLVLNTTAATADALDRWNDTAPTSSVFSLGDGVEVNTNTEDYVAYCFAEVEGFSKFGSYTGNASADGPFVYTGFRPAFIMIKNSTSGAGPSWQIRDNKRVGYNPANAILYPNLSNAEYSVTGNFEIDFVSNGFKIRTGTDAGCNGSGDTMIFAAFAENPFKTSLAR